MLFVSISMFLNKVSISMLMLKPYKNIHILFMQNEMKMLTSSLKNFVKKFTQKYTLKKVYLMEL